MTTITNKAQNATFDPEMQDLLAGLAGTLGVSAEQYNPSELLRMAAKRVTELEVPAELEGSFDAAGLELGMLRSLTQQVCDKTGLTLDGTLKLYH